MRSCTCRCSWRGTFIYNSSKLCRISMLHTPVFTHLLPGMINLSVLRSRTHQSVATLKRSRRKFEFTSLSTTRNNYQLKRAIRDSKETNSTACLCVRCHRITRKSIRRKQSCVWFFFLIAKELQRGLEFLRAKNKAFLIVHVRAGSPTFLDFFNVISSHNSPTDARSERRTMETWIIALNLTSKWSHCENGTEKESNVNDDEEEETICGELFDGVEKNLTNTLQRHFLHHRLSSSQTQLHNRLVLWRVITEKSLTTSRTHLEIVVDFNCFVAFRM